MMGEDELRRRLTRMLEITAGATNVVPATYWVGDKAGERRVMDDLKFGRLNWRSANRTAAYALNMLNAGDLDEAQEIWVIANDYYVSALESRITPDDLEDLSTSAKNRGRQSVTAERNTRLADAVERQASFGIRGPAGRAAAIKSDPELKAAFAGLTDEAIRKALRSSRKS